jgi:hypothetical protein
MDTVIQDATPKPGDSITFTESQPNALPGNNYMYVVAMIPEANYTANVDVNTEGTVDGTIVTFQGLSLNEKVTIYTDGTSDGTTFYLHGMSGDHTLTKDNLKDTDFMEQLAKDELAKSDIAFAVKNTTATMGVDIEVPTTDTMPIGKYIVLSAAVDRNTGLISAINQTSIDLGATWTFKLVKGWNLISIPLTLSDNSVDAFFPSTVKANLTDMWYYDSGNWIYYSGTRGYSPKYAHLTTLTPGKGYWVKLNSDATFTVTGTVVSGLPTASAGWTMFGVKGLNSINVITAYPNNKDMWTYANGQWYYYSGSRGYSPKYPHINSLEPGIGYWVHI